MEELDDRSFNTKVLSSEHLWLVHFHTASCAACKPLQLEWAWLGCDLGLG